MYVYMDSGLEIYRLLMVEPSKGSILLITRKILSYSKFGVIVIVSRLRVLLTSACAGLPGWIVFLIVVWLRVQDLGLAIPGIALEGSVRVVSGRPVFPKSCSQSKVQSTTCLKSRL